MINDSSANLASTEDMYPSMRNSTTSAASVAQTEKAGVNHNFNRELFASQFSRRESKKPLPNPDVKVKRLMEKLLKIYMEYFNRGDFCEEKQELVNKAVLPTLVDKMKSLRDEEHRKLSSREIIFDQAMDCDEARKDAQDILRCFWINLFNFKILQKTLEILLLRPKMLKKELNNCSMAICLMHSIKISIQGEELTCLEVFKTMLKHDDMHMMTGPFEEQQRCLSEMPQALQELAVTK